MDHEAAVRLHEMYGMNQRHLMGRKTEVRQRINRAAADIYAFWRDLRNLPLFMSRLSSVEILSSVHSRWQWRTGRLRMCFEWEAEIIQDEPERLIAWQTRDGSSVLHTGSVCFNPVKDAVSDLPETSLEFQVRYRLPLGAVGAWVSELFGESPGRVLQSDLGRLKVMMETKGFWKGRSQVPLKNFE